MIRAALLGLAALCGVMQAAAADDWRREDLRIPMAAAGPRGLEAMLLRPPGARRYPLALISHGSPRAAADRPAMNPYRLYAQATEFARRGFASLVVMRRGYGTSDGGYAESSGPCDHRDYRMAGQASATDLRAAIDAMRGRADVTTEGMIAVGVSAGGFASVALAADPPPGLAAIISFAGGRGSRADNDVCDEAALVAAFAGYGRTARLPMLWVYAANDKFLGPDLAHRLHGAFTAAGGRAQLIDAPAFGSDGHALFSAAGVPAWTPIVNGFLREQGLGSRDLIAAPGVTLAPPPQLRGTGRAAFDTYLASGPHRAFAASPKGAFAFRTGERSVAEAEEKTLAACAKYAGDCAIYAVDDRLAVTAEPRPR
ncbi:MAG: dienelactone hydrolase family protein [Tardiphaga sp.]|nr:dienelactone hydrolase family protein [Tardiphaga sp.]